MTVVETRMSVWEALAGRAPGQPRRPGRSGPVERGRRAAQPGPGQPGLRAGIERSTWSACAASPYVMLRSPDDAAPPATCGSRPEEWQLAQLMDGSRTVARLVAEFARIGGRLAPDQVTRVVADLAGNRMLDELPVDAFRPLRATVHRRPWPIRLGRGAARLRAGRRVVLADIDPLVSFLYRAGGRLLFTRAAAVLLARRRAGRPRRCSAGPGGAATSRSFLTDGSYVARRARRCSGSTCSRWPATSWATRWPPSTPAGGCRPPGSSSTSASRRSSSTPPTCGWPAAGPGSSPPPPGRPPGWCWPASPQLVGLLVPAAAPWTFKLAFAWYLNALFNLNPFLALDGYYLLMDWLEIPNLRARGLAWVVGRLRRRPPRWAELDREGRLVALYGMLARALAGRSPSTSATGSGPTGSPGWSPGCGGRAGRPGCCWSP